MKILLVNVDSRWNMAIRKMYNYIYYHPSMDLHQLFERVEWCRKRECLPYVMRDIACWDCESKEFLIDYAAYCNQPGMFKNLTFAEWLTKRQNSKSISEKRRIRSLEIFIQNGGES